MRPAMRRAGDRSRRVARGPVDRQAIMPIAQALPVRTGPTRPRLRPGRRVGRDLEELDHPVDLARRIGDHVGEIDAQMRLSGEEAVQLRPRAAAAALRSAPASTSAGRSIESIDCSIGRCVQMNRDVGPQASSRSSPRADSSGCLAPTPRLPFGFLRGDPFGEPAHARLARHHFLQKRLAPPQAELLREQQRLVSSP